MKNFYRRSIYAIVFLLLLAALILLSLSQAKAATLTSFNYHIQKQINGQVTNQEGAPLLGVTVLIKNRRYGTTTTKDGSFSLNASANDTLVFSFIGYKRQEIALQGRTYIEVQLEEDIAALGEVQINAGYYNVTERERTGNISRVTAEEIEKQPVVNPIQALQGRMAGVEVTSGGSHPGAAPTIRIRGINSLRAEGNYPLYIIDGVPINSVPVKSNSMLKSSGLDPLNNLGISNIESIEVLKDADATAIYGSRGANGVILITTKKGKGKGTHFEAGFYTGVSRVPSRLDLLNTQDYLKIRRTAFENDGVEPTQYNAYDLVLWDQNRYTDWQDVVFGGSAQTRNADLAFSGGSENTSFRLGGSYYSQGTVYPGAFDYHKITGNLNLGHHADNDKLNINLSLNYGIDNNNLAGNLSLHSAIILPPNAPALFNEDGSLNWEEWKNAGLNNPFRGYFNTSNTKTHNLVSNVGLSYELIKDFRLKTSLGYSYYNSEELWKLPARSYSPSDNRVNSSFYLSSNRKSWIIEPQLVFDKQFGNLKLEAIAGTTLQENKTEQVEFEASGYASEVLIGNFAAAESIINAENKNTDYRYAALFSRIGLNWDRKYYLNLTGRRDGSSRFGPNNRLANFGAIGAAWIFTAENFSEKFLPFLSFGKIRGSYGTTGNDQIGDYGYLDAYEATIGPGGLYPTKPANPDYSWEVNKKLEAGIELGFIKDRFRTNLSWYRNRTSNQLVGYPLPAITGFSSVQANLPATVENSGWEIEIFGKVVEKGDFIWQTSFNISVPKNELVNYPDIEQSSYANTYRVGSPLNISLNYQYEGLDPETGFYTIKDVNDDGRFDYEDQVIIQDKTRKYFGGFNNALSYKNFSLEFLWEFVKQEGSLSLFNTSGINNMISSTTEALQEGSKYQKVSQSYQAKVAYYYLTNTTFPIVDGSFFRLKSLSLGYNLPQTITEKLGMEHCRLFLHGQNLLTISPYKGLDPESSYDASGFNNYRSITGGVQINL